VDVAAVPNQQLSPIRSKRSRSRKAISKGNVPEGKQRRELELPSLLWNTEMTPGSR